MKNKAACKLIAFLLAMAMSLCTGFTVNAEETDNGVSQQEEETGQLEPMQESALRSAPNLSNPRIETDDSMTAGQKVTWDCVWFGSYPQAEVVPSADDYTALDKSMLRSGDIIEDSGLYNKLKSASGWDANNDITTDGNKYRRIKKGDATYTNTVSGYYNWSDTDTYHYFKYEPIKWRVLRADGDQAFLLSDIALDDQRYNIDAKSITWETSTIRSWLNGYGVSSNKPGEDYSSKNFIGSAFSGGEKSAIVNTTVVNDDNINYGTEGGNNTTDKIFLLSESETYGDSAVAHGFVSSRDTYDEARRSKSSMYVKAMGAYSSTSDAYKGNCRWWLRSPGYDTSYDAADVDDSGYVNNYGRHVWYDDYGVRAALNLNLSSNLHTYAGTVGSNGEENIPVTGIKLSKNEYQMKVGDREQITASVLPENATDKRVDWTSSDNLIAEIDSNGTVTAKASGKCTIQCTAASDSTISQSAEIEIFTDKTEDSGSENNSTNKPAGNTGSAKQNQSINTSASTYTKAIDSKAFFLRAHASGGGKLTYTSSNKKVATVSSTGQVSVKSYGTATITINASATQNYNTATKKVSIKVVPKKASLKAVKSPSKKKMKMSWRKDKKVTGYEIYVSPKKDFSRETIKRNYKKNTVSKTISGWKSKRTYYVKIRGYKKIGKVKYYGAWSNVKKVKVK